MATTRLIPTNGEWVAAKKGPIGGKPYDIDDPIDVSQFPDRIFQRLVKYNYIKQANGGAGKPTQEPVKVEPVAADEPVKAESLAPIATLRHAGAGYYRILDGKGNDVVSEKVQGKDNAAMIAKQMGYVIEE